MQSAIEFRVEYKTREQVAYEAIRQAIVAGRWQERQPLVASRLALELDVSRITVANALKRLSGEGFVQLTPHKEALVAPIERSDVRQIYLMRGELEALAASEAVKHVTAGDFAQLVMLNTDLDQRATSEDRDVRAVRAVDLVFHRQLRALSRMPRLIVTLENLADQCEGYRARLLDSYQIAVPTAARHGPILEALNDRNGHRLAIAMRQHVHEGMVAIFSLLDQSTSRPQTG